MEDTEVWKPIRGYEEAYEVSTHGRVRSIDRLDGIGRRRRGAIMAQQPHPKTGHMQVTLSRGARGIQVTHKVHQLVLDAFVGPREPGLMGCHNDGNPGNNHASNLRWDTAYANSQDRYKHGTAYATHCRRGHPMTRENLSIWGNQRRCKACAHAQAKAKMSGATVTQELADAEYARLFAPVVERTHCKWGHELTEENTYRRGNYWRCKKCQTKRDRLRRRQ